MRELRKGQHSAFIKTAHGNMKSARVYAYYKADINSVVFCVEYAQIPYVDKHYFNDINEVDTFIAESGLEVV